MKELRIVLRHHVSIHPEDAFRALRKRLCSGKTIESAADHMVIDGIATTFREGRELDDDQREWIAQRYDKKMAQRIAKAARSTRTTFSPVQRFVLSTWRQLEVNGKQLPGLRHWKSSAAVVLLQEARVMRKDASEQDYNSLIFDLDLERGELIVTSLARNANREWVVVDIEK